MSPGLTLELHNQNQSDPGYQLGRTHKSKAWLTSLSLARRALQPPAESHVLHTSWLRVGLGPRLLLPGRCSSRRAVPLLECSPAAPPDVGPGWQALPAASSNLLHARAAPALGPTHCVLTRPVEASVQIA